MKSIVTSCNCPCFPDEGGGNAHDAGEAVGPLVAQGIQASLAANTRKTYSTGWRSWARWAEDNGLPIWSATPAHLQGWLAFLAAEGKATDTLRTYRAAVAHCLDDRPGPNPARDPQVRRLLAGLARQAADKGRTPRQADPLRWTHIILIVETAYTPRHNQPGGRKETTRQARQRANIDIAMIALAHDALLRCSELLALTWADINLPANGGRGTVQIRRSKTDQNAQGAVVPISEFAAQALARIKPTAADPEDRVFAISPSTVSRRFKAAAQAAGINPANITTHSPRVGMAQDLVAWGIDMPGLMLAGRWATTTTAARYTRNLAAHHTPAARYLKTQHHTPAAHYLKTQLYNGDAQESQARSRLPRPTLATPTSASAEMTSTLKKVLAAGWSRPHLAQWLGMRGTRTQLGWSGPKCTVTWLSKISGGRFRTSSCRNGPQPRSSFLKFDSRSPVVSPSHS